MSRRAGPVAPETGNACRGLIGVPAVKARPARRPPTPSVG
jgi:hypothetical protein